MSSRCEHLPHPQLLTWFPIPLPHQPQLRAGALWTEACGCISPNTGKSFHVGLF